MKTSAFAALFERQAAPDADYVPLIAPEMAQALTDRKEQSRAETQFHSEMDE